MLILLNTLNTLNTRLWSACLTFKTRHFLKALSFIGVSDLDNVLVRCPSPNWILASNLVAYNAMFYLLFA